MNKDAFREELLEICQEYTNRDSKLESFCEVLKDIEKYTGVHEVNPQKPKLEEVKGIGEVAFQRAIFNNKKSILQFRGGITKEVEWLDLELPVSFEEGKARRKCVDLIGKIDDIPVICELKFMNKAGGDSPEYGIFELLMYYTLILYNKENLEKEGVRHSFENYISEWKWSDIVCENPILIFCANKTYWSYWENKTNNLACIFELVDLLNEKLNVDIKLFQTADIDFEEQKKNSGKNGFKPIVESIDWFEVNNL